MPTDHPVTPTYFSTPAEFRAWLSAHAAAATELSVGFYKSGSGLPGISWPQAVDEALCVGWIDGVRHRIDDQRYRIRFSPRKPGSIWSAVNIDRVAVLTVEGRMTPAGVAAFERRSENRSRVYSHEQSSVAEFAPDLLARFQSDPSAWIFFLKQAPSYRQRLTWWVVNAKQAATREKRLDTLMAACAESRRL